MGHMGFWVCFKLVIFCQEALEISVFRTIIKLKPILMDVLETSDKGTGER